MHVAVVMGSDSDLPVMKKAFAILDNFGVSYDAALAGKTEIYRSRNDHQCVDPFCGNVDIRRQPYAGSDRVYSRNRVVFPCDRAYG